MSSINSLNSSSCIGAIFCTQTNKLSEATKAKLQALGIDPSSVSSEAEALTLISQVEAMSKTDKARPQCASSEQFYTNQENIFVAMNMIAHSNKYTLGLN